MGNEPALSPAQARVLYEVRQEGQHVYNGRMRRTVEALERAGLVEVEYDHLPQAKGNGIELVERLTVRPRYREAEDRGRIMTEDVVEDLVRHLLEQHDVDDWEAAVERVSTFSDTGVLTRDRGVVVAFADGSEYHLTIVRSR